MDFARHDAILRKPAKDGVATRVHLESAARRGHATAIAKLQGPPFPESLSELWQQFKTLDSMRREATNGLAALTPGDIRAANELFDWDLRPHEADAIRAIDLVVRYLEHDKKDIQ